jgi:hypothetical protein
MGRFLVRDDGSCGCGADPCRCGRREQTRDAAPVTLASINRRNRDFWAGKAEPAAPKPPARDAASPLDWSASPAAQIGGLRGLNLFYRKFWESRR